jgi:hypothetical protein
MEHTTSFSEENNYCTITTSGIFRRPDDTIKMQELAKKISKESGCNNFLFDMRMADIKSDTMDDYAAGKVPLDTDGRQRVQSIALLYSENLRKHSFIETVGRNRGYNIRLFNDYEEAMGWLAKKS